MRVEGPAITSWLSGREPDVAGDGSLRLCAELDWKVVGPSELLDQVEASLPGYCDRPIPGLLRLSFGNSVGFFDVPHLGRVEVVSGKWRPEHFRRMLDELTNIAAALPFSAGTGSALPFDRSLPTDRDVLYHAFVYLRHVLTEVDDETNLARAYTLILADPHQRLVTEDRQVRLEDARTVTPRAVYELVSGSARMSRAGPAADTPIARALGGWLPETVWERVARRDVDTPENRFAQAFLGQVLWVVEQMEMEVARLPAADPFGQRIRRDCAQLARLLLPIRCHRFWREIGPMTAIPAASTVLQRRRGYREVMTHFSRLRLASTVPLDQSTARRLLEAKDIATLYELWCYFKVVEAMRDRLGPPTTASGIRYDPLHGWIEHGYDVSWPGGLRVVYNLRFARDSAGYLRSYSLPLRPDIAIVIPEAGGTTLHLLDAKFKLQAQAEAGAGGGDDEESSDATFKRDDLNKMHAYRDAIPAARSVRVLYPGTVTAFFDAAGVVAATSRQPGASASGVGATPLRPDDGGDTALSEVLAELLASRATLLPERPVATP